RKLEARTSRDLPSRCIGARISTDRRCVSLPKSRFRDEHRRERPMTKCTPSFFIASMLALALYIEPAQAQTRVFVAAQGADANPCTFALPCRTFQRAHDAVLGNGEIDVLDPAGYAALTITKPIRIQGHGISVITVTSGVYVTV